MNAHTRTIPKRGAHNWAAGLTRKHAVPATKQVAQANSHSQQRPQEVGGGQGRAATQEPLPQEAKGSGTKPATHPEEQREYMGTQDQSNPTIGPTQHDKGEWKQINSERQN